MDIKKLAARLAANNHKANTLNRNIGSSGTNITNDKMQGNRGKQMNPNQRSHSGAAKVVEHEDDEPDPEEIFGSLDSED